LEEKKQKREERQKVEEMKKFEAQRKEETVKKNLHGRIEKDKEIREKEKKLSSEILQIYQSAPFQEFFRNHSKSIACIYQHYKENPERQTMLFNEFLAFGSQFQISTSLISVEQLKGVFRTITREKQGEIGLNHDDFIQGLLRISCKASLALNQIAQISKERIRKVKPEEIKEILIKSKSQHSKNKSQANTSRGNMSQQEISVDDDKESIHPKLDFIEGLLIFMDIPTDLIELKLKLKNLRKENQKLAPPPKESLPVIINTIPAASLSGKDTKGKKAPSSQNQAQENTARKPIPQKAPAESGHQSHGNETKKSTPLSITPPIEADHSKANKSLIDPPAAVTTNRTAEVSNLTINERGIEENVLKDLSPSPQKSTREELKKEQLRESLTEVSTMLKQVNLDMSDLEIKKSQVAEQKVDSPKK